MNDSSPAAGPEPGAPLHPDPAIAAELEFLPVRRKVKRPDGWTPELQHEFIRLLAKTGSPQQACTIMDKNVTGIEALYKVPAAHSFRAAWDRAVAIGRRAQGLDCGPPHLGPVPGIQRRGSAAAAQAPSPPEEDEDEAGDDEHKLELIENLAIKFLRKVVAEREARLGGQIVAADFYLRQITQLEVLFDLLAGDSGLDAWDRLKQVQRGGHGALHIVDTPFARYLDGKRREYWASSGEPMRPAAFRDEYLEDHGDHRTAIDQHVYGATSPPARGYCAEQWATMGNDAQRAARQAQFDEDAEEQVRYERAALAAYQQSLSLYGTEARRGAGGTASTGGQGEGDQ